MAQYATPQFIEKEGRIVFFLTFRQFFLLVGGGAACLVLYYTLPFYLFIIGSIFIMGLVAIIAFLKINNESVVKVLLHFIGFLFGEKNYVWKRKESTYSPNPEIQASKIMGVKKMVDIKK